MRVLITGATGLIGRAINGYLKTKGVETVTLVRKPPVPSDSSHLYWDPDKRVLNPHGLEQFDAVVHLAGENIAAGRWTVERKRRIFDSRIKGTSLLSTALAACATPPKVAISASAVGYYGDCGNAVLEESAGPGRGFLAETCRAWEAAAQPLVDAGVRTIFLRTGMVLSPSGGALERMLLPFRLGVGGPIGLGQRWMSWITLDDLVRLIVYCLEQESLSGPVNAVSPQPVTNLEFAHTLGRLLRRPALLPTPPLALRLAFGEMARELLLSSTRAVPKRLEDAQFDWRRPQIEDALRYCLHKTS
ncbi:MAG: Epimerase family protein [Candidatus Hydrogenedentes bacterium ADurb.Bin101]|nr:MAG: Epimerase family protein [Candidatus Hydrogenedentes bacterium ADurb.Bin101]HOC70571.1 TIGR01777 family oxidoreductase [Candidatus Hydrogenedentota bacterium]